MAKHDEAVGTVGEAPQNNVVVETPEDVARVTVPDENNVAYVTQTTLSVADASRIISALQKAISEDRRAAERRHLLCDHESPGGGE
jgi:4-hydroxy-3-methylbut-2-enyl diphosphate reductase IspH